MAQTIQFVAGDGLGNIHIADCTSFKIQRSNQEAKLEKSIKTMCWSGPLNDQESELSVGRADGIVQSYKLQPTLHEDVKNISLPSPIVYISHLNPRSYIIDTLLSCSISQNMPATTSENMPTTTMFSTHNTSSFYKDLLKLTYAYRFKANNILHATIDPIQHPFSDSLFSNLNDKLFCVAEKGHTCVLPWGNNYNPIKTESITFKHICNNFDRKRTPKHCNEENIDSAGFYMLPAPISSATTHPWLPNFLAFGGVENDVKIFDIFGEKIIWAARNVKRSELDLRFPVNVTAIEWLPKININVLAAASKLGKVRIYDLRVQRRPVNEIHVTQEKRPITSMSTYTPKLPKPSNRNSTQFENFDKTPSSHSIQKFLTQKSEWPLYLSDTHGMLYQLCISKLDSATHTPTYPENFGLSLKGNFKGQMGSSSELNCSNDGKWLLSVGLGRHALIYNTQSRKLNSKIYLKHKLYSGLFKPISSIKKDKKRKKR